MKRLLVLVRREFWEHRMLWAAPLAVAAVVLLGVNALPGHLMMSGSFDFSPGPDAPPDGDLPASVLSELWLFGLSAPFYITAGIVAVSYFLDCLYGERRDRSILFWRSLPVSDTATVLTKLLVGLVLLPLTTYLLAAATSLAVAATARFHGGNSALPAALAWDGAAWLRYQGLMLYTLAAAVIWYAPYAAYLMLVSAWAKRSTYAWAFIPPVVAAVLERALFGTHYVGRVVQRGFRELTGLAFGINRQLGTLSGSFAPGRGGGGGGGGGGRGGWNPVLDPSGLLHSPQLWLGLAAAALMLWVTIQVRRHRDDV